MLLYLTKCVYYKIVMIVQYNDLSYELNLNDLTAKVLQNKEVSGDIFIPKSINYNSNEYIITELSEKADRKSVV